MTRWRLFRSSSLLKRVLCFNLLMALVVVSCAMGYVYLHEEAKPQPQPDQQPGGGIGIMSVPGKGLPERPEASPASSGTDLTRENVIVIGVAFLSIGILVATASAVFFMRTTSKTAEDLAQDISQLSEDPHHKIDTYPGLLGELAELFTEVSQGQQEARQLMSLVLNHLDCAVVLIDREGNVRFSNQNAQLWFGINRDGDELVAPPQADGVLKEAFSSLKNGVRLHNKVYKLDSTNQPRILELSTNYVNLDGHYRDSVMLIARDVTKMKVLEEQMVYSDQLAAAGQLAAEAVHEIRNPLTAIRGFSQLIASMSADDPVVPKYANYMIEEVDRLDGIVRELLALARPSERNWQEVNVKSLVHEALTIVQPKAIFYGIELHVDVDVSMQITCQKNKIKQVFTNLFLNAVQAMTEGGHLAVRGAYCEEAEFICLEIKDTGCGIPKHMLDSIFQPFVTTKPKGTGLGLVVVNKIISEHGGIIETESEEEQGTMFSIKLPIIPPGSQPEQEFRYF